MKKIVIMIETVNAAFEPEEGDTYLQAEVGRILHQLAEGITNGHQPETLRDFNGNKVGTVTYE